MSQAISANAQLGDRVVSGDDSDSDSQRPRGPQLTGIQLGVRLPIRLGSGGLGVPVGRAADPAAAAREPQAAVTVTAAAVGRRLGSACRCRPSDQAPVQEIKQGPAGQGTGGDTDTVTQRRRPDSEVPPVGPESWWPRPSAAGATLGAGSKFGPSHWQGGRVLSRLPAPRPAPGLPPGAHGVSLADSERER